MHQATVGKQIGSPQDNATILLFDSTLTKRNAVGGLDTQPKPGRHEGRNGFAFADGHGQYVKAR